MRQSHTRSLLLLASWISLAGCVGYTSYRPEEGDRIEGTLFTTPAVQTILAKSLRFSIDRMPPSLSEASARLNILEPSTSHSVAVSLPRGLTKTVHDDILATLGDGVQPVVDGHEGVPIYRVGEVRVRGRSASVDIHRPLDVEDGQEASYQCVTIYLRSNLRGWRVDGYEAWMPGTVELPELNALRMIEESETASVEEEG